MTNQNLLALTMASASAMATSSSGLSPTTGTRSGLRARTTQVRANPVDSDPAEDSSTSKEKPRVATASKRKHDDSEARVATASKRKHDDSEDDSEDDDPPSKKRKCGRRSHELCSDCVSGDSRRHASQHKLGSSKPSNDEENVPFHTNADRLSTASAFALNPVNLHLCNFSVIQGYGDGYICDPYDYYGSRFSSEGFPNWEEIIELKRVRETLDIPFEYDQCRPEVYMPETFARSLEDVVLIILAHYPVHSDYERPMSVDRDGNFRELSLKAIADAFITAIAEAGKVHRTTARCMFYSSVIVVNALPISGNASFGAMNKKGQRSDIYNTAFAATRVPVKALLRRVLRECPNAKGIFGAGAGHDYCHELIEGLPIELLNDDRVCHPSKNKRGYCRVVEQIAWINEVAKVICHVSGVSLSIGDDVGIRNSICYVTPHFRAQHAEKQAAKEVADQLAATKRAEKQAELEALTERVAFNRAERAEKQAAKLAADKLEIENNLAERDSIKRDEEIERVAAAKEAADKLAAGTNCTGRASSSKNEQQWVDTFECLVRYIEETREMATRHMSEEQKATWFWDGNVPYSYKTPCGKALGSWINKQRSARVKDTLTTDREVRLISTGLRWRMIG